MDAETTPAQLVTARPDGTFTVEFDPEPVRVHQASGWVPVDTGLTIAADGRLTPKAAADVTFSGGGAHDPLARITQDGKTYSEGRAGQDVRVRGRGAVECRRRQRPGRTDYGKNHLPGWATGDPATNSAWTAPVGCRPLW
ncbi:hypothetical protein ACIRP7_25250 [Streptomyces sp. NPDC102270]|uniref:hypothetical protein n=1 Tax=Streptomyces sp. NPDC102270 TaxID=3366150 RepID=UPI00381CD46C